MRVAVGFAALLSWSAVLLNLGNGLAPITIKGKRFYYNNGNEFFVKGIIYVQDDSPHFDDPLQNTAQCQIDAQLIQGLSANTISVNYIVGVYA